MRCNVATQWDRPELGQQGKTPDGEFRVYDVFVPEATDEPQAYLVRSFSEHATVGTHFHEHPQFQVFVEGSGTFQRHGVGPVDIHYTDAFAVYGPIIAGDEGLSFFVLRPHRGQGAHYMPGSREQLVRRGRRNLSARLDADALRADGSVTVFDDPDGLHVEARLLGPGDVASLAPVPPGSSGCYTLVLDGECEVVGTEFRSAGTFSMIHRTPDDAPVSVAAGAAGATILSMQFPAEEDAA
ncbi:MAG: hypothetical protein HZB15_02875 [Actinobacteria bacterium]|nr:hypothetical protein [Actinomycetota bacterium]